jgi:uncharacterized membrane protein
MEGSREARALMRGQAFACGLFFTVAGALHFMRPAMYQKIVPPAFGHAGELVVVSGIAEIAGGIGLMFPPTRRAAGLGLIALLVAVWPANIWMAVDARRFATVAPAWALWCRVPLQLLVMWWVRRASR